MNRKLRTSTRLLLVLPVTALAVSLAACAGGGTGGSDGSARPSVDEISTGMSKILEDSGQGDLLTDEQVDCVAGELADSEISDQDLQNVADGKDIQTSEDAKQLVTTTMQEAVGTCAAQ